MSNNVELFFCVIRGACFTLSLSLIFDYITVFSHFNISLLFLLLVVIY